LLAIRILRVAADIPRRLLGVAAALLVAGLLCAALWTVGTFDETSRPLLGQQTPPSVRAVASQWRKTPLPQDERRIDISVQQPARHLDAKDIEIFVFGTILLIIGGYWFVLPWHIHRRRMNEAKQNIEEGLKRRREMSLNANRNNVSRRLAYHVVRVPPMREEVASDTATVLGRLFGRIEGATLDLNGTIDATIAAGGRFVLVKKERRVSRTITVLVDIESGSHPWLHDIDWLLDRWRALGVQFQRYDFHDDPHFLYEATTRLPTRLERLARRVEGEPLVIISRKLTSQQFRGGEAPWLRDAQTWPVRAWIDPSPRPHEELPSAYRNEIERLTRLGFCRFPFTAPGLAALAVYLASEGRSVVVPDWPVLPALSDPNVTRALEKWVLFASLVPDPTWDQLQAVRESFPEIRADLTENQHLQRLLDWVESDSRNASQRAESGDGRTLELDPDLVNDIIMRFRRSEAGLPASERFEARCRQLLLTQLDATRPDDPLMHGFWQLKRMHHQLVVDPDKAAALLGPLIAGPWHDEAIEAVNTELDRDAVTRSMPRAIRDGFALAVGTAGNRLRIGDLFRLRPIVFGPAVASILVLVTLAAASLEFTFIGKPLLGSTQSFEGVLPRDYRLVMDTASENPETKDTGPSRGVISETDEIANARLVLDQRGLASTEDNAAKLRTFVEECKATQCQVLEEATSRLRFAEVAETARNEVFNLRNQIYQGNGIGGRQYSSEMLRKRFADVLTEIRRSALEVEIVHGRRAGKKLDYQFSPKFRLEALINNIANQITVLDHDYIPSGPPDFWEANGSRLRRVFYTGTDVRFVFDLPVPALGLAGVIQGMTFFVGTARSDRYEGHAYAYMQGCEPTAFAAAGNVSSDQRRVVLRGRLPVVRDRSCYAFRHEDVTIEFTFHDRTDNWNAPR
jgi:hypothetical protein